MRSVVGWGSETEANITLHEGVKNRGATLQCERGGDRNGERKGLGVRLAGEGISLIAV